MKLALAIGSGVLCLALSACHNTKTQDLAECRLDADKVFPQGPETSHADHTTTCMQTRNYKWRPLVGAMNVVCGGDWTLSHYTPDCYHTVGLWEQAKDR